MLQAIDEALVQFLNRYARKSVVFDHLVDVVVSLPTVKILPIVVALVWVWFTEERSANNRVILVKGLAGTFLALVLARLTQNLTPFRPRPMHADDLEFVLPHGISPDRLQDWSTFPSDTATLAFALAATVWCASRPLGWICVAWAVIIALPRIYAGFHYPSDIVAGALLGLVMTLACMRFIGSNLVTKTALFMERKLPYLFYSIGFVILFQFVTFFEDIRRTARGLARLF